MSSTLGYRTNEKFCFLHWSLCRRKKRCSKKKMNMIWTQIVSLHTLILCAYTLVLMSDRDYRNWLTKKEDCEVYICTLESQKKVTGVVQFNSQTRKSEVPMSEIRSWKTPRANRKSKFAFLNLCSVSGQSTDLKMPT